MVVGPARHVNLSCTERGMLDQAKAVPTLQGWNVLVVLVIVQSPKHHHHQQQQ
jgi:hypothetical protein